MSDIFEQRQAFNFYRSYYDTSLLLDTENRTEFLDSILHYQFTGEIKEPLKTMALLAFRGQLHSLKKQVIGFQRGKETYPSGNPTKGSGKASYKGEGKEVQEKEQVQEKEKEEVEHIIDSGKPEKLDFDLLLQYLNKKTGRSFRTINETVKRKYNSTLKQGYTKDDIRTAIDNAVNAKNHIENNFQYLTLEFFSRPDKLDMYSAKKESKSIEGETEEEKDLRIRRESFKKIKVH